MEIPLAGGARVSGLLIRPDDARALYVLGHGAGAGMTHPVLETLAARFAAAGIATLRYQFPYMDAGRRAPDRRPVLLDAVEAAAARAARLAPELPLVAGGKSMGGRMASMAAAENRLAAVSALVFVGFPLHPAGRPGTERATHLERVGRPMLFLQGTRDRLADLTLLEPIVRGFGPPSRTHVVEDADHSFAMTKRSGRTRDEVLDELAVITAAWIGEVVAGAA